MTDKNFVSSILQYDASEDTTYLTHGIFRWYGKLVPSLVDDVPATDWKLALSHAGAVLEFVTAYPLIFLSRVENLCLLY